MGSIEEELRKKGLAVELPAAVPKKFIPRKKTRAWELSENTSENYIGKTNAEQIHEKKQDESKALAGNWKDKGNNLANVLPNSGNILANIKQYSSNNEAIEKQDSSHFQARGLPDSGNIQAIISQDSSLRSAIIKQEHGQIQAEKLPESGNNQAIEQQDFGQSSARTQQSSSRLQAIELPESDEKPGLKQDNCKTTGKKLARLKLDKDKIDLRESLYVQLVGLQKNALFFIFQKCIERNDLVTPIFYTRELADHLSASADSTKDATEQLKKKGILKSLSKRGAGGYLKFELNADIYDKMVAEMGNPTTAPYWQDEDRAQARSLPDRRQEKPSSKLVSSLNTNLQNEDGELSEFYADWGGLEDRIAMLKPWGISTIQLGHMRNQKLRLYGWQILDLIERMAIYASVPKNLGGMSNPIGFFMKNCQQKSRGEDCFLDSVETAEEQDARQRLEKRKADRERARQEGKESGRKSMAMLLKMAQRAWRLGGRL